MPEKLADLGRSLVELGQQLAGGDPVDPVQLGEVLRHVGSSMVSQAKRFAEVESRLAALEAPQYREKRLSDLLQRHY